MEIYLIGRKFDFLFAFALIKSKQTIENNK